MLENEFDEVLVSASHIEHKDVVSRAKERIIKLKSLRGIPKARSCYITVVFDQNGRRVNMPTPSG